MVKEIKKIHKKFYTPNQTLVWDQLSIALGAAAPDLTYALASRITAGGLHARPFLRGGNPCTSPATAACSVQLSPSRQKAASVAGLKRALLLRRELFFASFFL